MLGVYGTPVQLLLFYLTPMLGCSGITCVAPATQVLSVYLHCVFKRVVQQIAL